MRLEKGYARAAELDAARRGVSVRRRHLSSTSYFTFLLNAIVCAVTHQQPNIINIFLVAAVLLWPPTLIVASIYGMNFQPMLELDWQYGYLVAIALMIMAAILPFVYFKWKKWL